MFLVDEAQFLRTNEFEALIAGLHRTVQRQLPITLVGAGLPQLPRLAGEAKSYAERLFKFPRIGQLSADEAEAAFAQPAAELGVTYEPGAIDVIVDYTEGYPYFIQEYGSKGLIYTTGHGRGDFTVPQFDRYMRRNHELAPPKLRR